MGDTSYYRYFDNFKELEDFIIKYNEVNQSDFNNFEIIFRFDKEEERVRKIIEQEKNKLEKHKV